MDRPKKKLNTRPRNQKNDQGVFKENREIRKDEDKLVAKICLERDKLI